MRGVVCRAIAGANDRRLGILLSGNAYLPLSPEYPEDRLAYMLENSQTRIIVTQSHLRERLLALAPLEFRW